MCKVTKFVPMIFCFRRNVLIFQRNSTGDGHTEKLKFYQQFTNRFSTTENARFLHFSHQKVQILRMNLSR